jgi:twitching motility protein PilT
MNAIESYFRKLDGLGANELLLSSDRPPLYRASNELLPLPGEGNLDDSELRSGIEALLSSDEWARLENEQQLSFVVALGPGRRVRGQCGLSQRGLTARLCLLRPQESLEDLQLPASLARFAEADSGLCLVTGPAGSGKSSLVASLLGLVAKLRNANIVSLENPIEYLQRSPSVSQRALGRDFASCRSAIDTALDTNADVIACAQLESEGVFELLVEAASSGVLVIAELPGHGSVNALEQLVTCSPLGQRSQLCCDLAECLLGVVSLDLLPRKGGGRIPALEILLASPNVASLVKDGKISMLASLLDREHGMQSMDRSLLDLASRGLVEGREAHARAIDKRAFQAWA